MKGYTDMTDKPKPSLKEDPKQGEEVKTAEDIDYPFNSRLGNMRDKK